MFTCNRSVNDVLTTELLRTRGVVKRTCSALDGVERDWVWLVISPASMCVFGKSQWGIFLELTTEILQVGHMLEGLTGEQLELF